MDKPSNLGELYEELKKYHSLKIEHQRHAHDMYSQDVTWARPLVPRDIPIFATSTPTELVDQIADQIRTDEPIVNFRPYANNEKARSHRTRMRRWGEKRLEDDREHAEIDPYGQASKDLPLRGEAVIKRLHNPDVPNEPMLSDYSTRERFEHEHDIWEHRAATLDPLLPARSIDPLDIFIPPNSAWPLPYVIEYQQRRQVDMWRGYPGWKAEQQTRNRAKFANGWRIIPGMGGLSQKDMDNPAREVQWLEYWSEDWYIVEVDGITVIDKRNPYGITPYCHSYSGYGRVDHSGSSADKAVGIIDKLRGELEAEVIARSFQFAAAQYYVFKRLLVPQGRANSVADQMAAGSVIEYESDPDEIQWLDSPQLSDSVNELLAQATSKINQRVNPVQRGAPGRALESGVQEAIALIQASTGITDPAYAINRLASQSLEIAARQMKALNLSVNIAAGELENDEIERGMKVDAADGDFDYPDYFEVEFKAFDPVEDTRRQEAGARLRRDKSISRETYQLKYLNNVVDDPEEENIQILFEDAQEAWVSSQDFQLWAVQQHMGQQSVAAAPDTSSGVSDAGIAVLGNGTQSGVTQNLLAQVGGRVNNPLQGVNAILNRATGLGQNARTAVAP